MNFFKVDGPIYQFMSTLTDVLVLSLCWLLCSLPIVTIGASTVALFDVTLRMADDEEGYVGRQFFKAFKNNFKQGTVLGIITLVCIYIIWLDFRMYNLMENPSMFLLIGGAISAFVFIFSLLYAYPLTARYENKLPQIMKNSFRISMKYFLKTLFIVAIVAIEVCICIWNTVTMFIAVLIGPGCIAYTIAAMAKPIFKQIEADNKSGEYDEEDYN